MAVGSVKITGLFNIVCVALLVFLCPIYSQAEISFPSFGNRTYVSEGATVNATWTYNFGSEEIRYVEWFLNTKHMHESPDFKLLADTFRGTISKKPSSLTNLNFTKPSTMVINNAKLDNNGTYRFVVNVAGRTPSPTSDITVIVLQQPIATVSCSSNNTINESYNFSCICNGTSGNPPPSATWSKNGKVFTGSGYLTNELLLKNATKYTTGNYTCTVRSHNLTDSEHIQLRVQYSPQSVLIRTNISSTYVEVNTAVEIICEADAFPEANYTIFHNGSALAGVVEGVYTIQSVKVSDRGWYSCVAENIIGRRSNSFELKVKARPTVNTTCSSKRNVVNESNAFTCLCESIGGYPPPNASWTKVGQNVVINGVGYLKKTLSFNNISRNDTGNYTCKVESVDLFNSVTIQVLVQYSPKNVMFKANISRAYVEVNTTVAITCTADAFPEARYTISRNGTTIPSDNGVYIINSVKSNDSGRYDCLAENIIGKRPKSFQLNVKVRPMANTNCSGKPNVVNESNAFTCVCESIGGYPHPNASWTKVGQDGVMNGVGYLNNALSFNNISRNDTGNYTCKVQSIMDLSDSITIEVRVQFKPKLLFFGNNATNNSVVFGSPVKIFWKANGYPPPKLTLWHNDTRVQQINDNDEEYIISSVNYTHAGKYDCRAENNLGNNTKSFDLTVHVLLPSGPTPSESDTGLSTGAIAGIAAGGLVFLILLLIIFCWLIPLIKQRKREKEEPQAEEAIMNSPDVNTLDGNAAKPENPYELAEEGIENGGADSDRPTTSATDKSTEEGNENGGADSDRPSTSATDNSAAPAAEPGLPPVYAVVDKSKLSVKKKPVDPSQLTYASLDPIALQPDSSKMRPRPKEESNYASIDLDKL